VCARFEGRAGRRSQRQLFCAALVGAGGARCAVRATLLGADTRPTRMALWRGTTRTVANALHAGARVLAVDDGQRCVGAAIALRDGDGTAWSLLAALPPPRRTPDAASVVALADAAARWPLLAAAILATPPGALWHEPHGDELAATWVRGRVALVGGAFSVECCAEALPPNAHGLGVCSSQPRRVAWRAWLWKL
jgi:hypothetical protein